MPPAGRPTRRSRSPPPKRLLPDATDDVEGVGDKGPAVIAIRNRARPVAEGGGGKTAEPAAFQKILNNEAGPLELVQFPPQMRHLGRKPIDPGGQIVFAAIRLAAPPSQGKLEIRFRSAIKLLVITSSFCHCQIRPNQRRRFTRLSPSRRDLPGRRPDPFKKTIITIKLAAISVPFAPALRSRAGKPSAND